MRKLEPPFEPTQLAAIVLLIKAIAIHIRAGISYMPDAKQAPKTRQARVLLTELLGTHTIIFCKN